MRQRTKAREIALQSLYQLNFTGEFSDSRISNILENTIQLSIFSPGAESDVAPESASGDSPAASGEPHPDVTSGRDKNTQSTNYARELVKGYCEHHNEIDSIIAKSAANWKLERLALPDKAILQLATYELIYRNDIPPAVSINEAIELAKKYGDTNSPSFVNGVLDKIASQGKKFTAETPRTQRNK